MDSITDPWESKLYMYKLVGAIKWQTYITTTH